MSKRLKPFIVISSVMAVLCAAVVGQAGESKRPSWKITGQLEEACTCDAACPCWFGSKPTKMTCGGGQLLFIERGRYGGVSLNGLAVGQMVESPEGKSMMESVGHWKFTFYYVDEKADNEQRKALLAIGKMVFPPDGEKTEVRYVPITRTIDGKEHHVVLGKNCAFSGHLLDGGLGGTPKIVNPPGANPIHAEYLQGQTSKLRYTDAGANWNLKDSNYMFGRFSVDSAQYERYAAGLAQKLTQMKKP